MLAIVPILAILFAVARGFGFDNLMEHQFRNGFGGNTETTEAILICQFLSFTDQSRAVHLHAEHESEIKHAHCGILAVCLSLFSSCNINSCQVSKYNAIYGSFAALPLFLLWFADILDNLFVWAELTYAGQNIRSFSFDQDTRNISRRYRDFISIPDYVT